MEAALKDASWHAEPTVLDSLRQTSAEYCQKWLKGCYDFRRWERHEILLGSPSADALRNHRETLSSLIKGTDLLMTLSAHPDSFENPFHSKFKILSQQLRDSWAIIHNPPGADASVEIKTFLATHFPE